MLTVVRFSIVDEFHSEGTNVSRAHLYYTIHIYIYISRSICLPEGKEDRSSENSAACVSRSAKLHKLCEVSSRLRKQDRSKGVIDSV